MLWAIPPKRQGSWDIYQPNQCLTFVESCFWEYSLVIPAWPAESPSKLKKAYQLHCLFHSDRSRWNIFSFTLGRIFQYKALQLFLINFTILIKTCQMCLSLSDVYISTDGIQLEDIQLPIFQVCSTWCCQYNKLA